MKIKQIQIFISLVLFIYVLSQQACSNFSSQSFQNSSSTLSNENAPTDFQWKTLKIGSGGWVTGIDIAPDGTKVTRGPAGFVTNSSASPANWRPLLTGSALPTDEVSARKKSGVYEIRIAPSNSSRLYMAYGGSVFRSDDQGNSWIKTSLQNIAMNANDGFKAYGQKMAVDPQNPDVVYFGTSSAGLYLTQDGGVTWASVPAIPKSLMHTNGQYPGYAGITFDPLSGQLNGKTKKIFVSSFGNGIYQSLDAGLSWQLLSGGPLKIRQGKMASDGSYYVIANDDKEILRYSEGVWTSVGPINSTWASMAIDPFNSSHLVAFRSGGNMIESFDKGATWSANKKAQRMALDIPWINWNNSSLLTFGDTYFDPIVPNRVWISEGIGVWYSDLPTSGTTYTVHSHTAGIEQLATTQILAPPGGKPLASSLDHSIFYVDNPDVYRDSHGPDNASTIMMSWSSDYASSQPQFIVSIFNFWEEKTGFSTDGGKTWTKFATHPPYFANGKLGGGIAASTPQNIVWAGSNNSIPYYTLNGGQTWTEGSFPGAPTSGATGWGASQYYKRQIVAADRVLSGSFYIYNHLKGLYRTLDGGLNWSLVFSGEISSGSAFNAKLKSVPGRAEHLFFTSGPVTSGTKPANSPFKRSTDGGATWSAIPGVYEVHAFGFGKSKVAGAYPAIYIAGWVNGNYGVYRSDDEGLTWVALGANPDGNIDIVVDIDGDKDLFGRVFLAFGSSGFAYGQMY